MLFLINFAMGVVTGIVQEFQFGMNWSNYSVFVARHRLFLDGLSITITSSVTSKLTQPATLHLSRTEAASISTVYLIGEVIGALAFGKLSDNNGRRNYSCGLWRFTRPAPA